MMMTKSTSTGSGSFQFRTTTGSMLLLLVTLMCSPPGGEAFKPLNSVADRSSEGSDTLGTEVSGSEALVQEGESTCADQAAFLTESELEDWGWAQLANATTSTGDKFQLRIPYASESTCVKDKNCAFVVTKDKDGKVLDKYCDHVATDENGEPVNFEDCFWDDIWKTGGLRGDITRSMDEHSSKDEDKFKPYASMFVKSSIDYIQLPASGTDEWKGVYVNEGKNIILEVWVKDDWKKTAAKGVDVPKDLTGHGQMGVRWQDVKSKDPGTGFKRRLVTLGTIETAKVTRVGSEAAIPSGPAGGSSPGDGSMLLEGGA